MSACDSAAYEEWLRNVKKSLVSQNGIDNAAFDKMMNYAEFFLRIHTTTLHGNYEQVSLLPRTLIIKFDNDMSKLEEWLKLMQQVAKDPRWMATGYDTLEKLNGGMSVKLTLNEGKNATAADIKTSWYRYFDAVWFLRLLGITTDPYSILPTGANEFFPENLRTGVPDLDESWMLVAKVDPLYPKFRYT
ncbi:hypothetical protein B0T17DRAFT_657507 [Bombardia bombarda]|uniref:Uncharacterized protein n=1 Tax=Bombardia bombarda TaxID=252184 RepID=A0AA39WH63_9PEZI|nr:hypothetical protein B0T17DRAFT_657507 [Bombardia bombarda]